MARLTVFNLAYILLALLFSATGDAEHVDRTHAVLSQLGTDPELTTFYNLFKSTGGTSGIPAPEFDERFNDNNSRLNFTILAPTNDALKQLPDALIRRLESADAYPLLASLLRTHILNDTLYPSDLLGTTRTAIQGFTITISATGNITSNKGISAPPSQSAPQSALLLSPSGHPVPIPASNGLIYKITHLIDPHITFFGESPTSPSSPAALPPQTYSAEKSMQEIVFSDPHLSRVREILSVIDPSFLSDRLTLQYVGEETGRNNKTVWLAPSDEALGLFGEKAVQSSLAVLTRFFLLSGFGGLQGQKGEEGEVVGLAGFEYKIQGDRVGNARVEKRTCGRNGCVWRIGKVLDPLYGL